jgi:Arc/MetJ-type ribon-helix-helix transcriptional regulator
MASNRLLASTPLTFELPKSLVDRIHECRGRLGLKSASDVVRRALAGFDYAGFQCSPHEQSQISVRLTPDQKRILVRTARQKKVSAGELLRAALEELAAAAPAAGRNGEAKSGLRPASGKTVKKLVAKSAGKKTAARRK